MRRESTVGALQAADLLTALSALGVPTAALHRASGLTPGQLRDAAARVPIGKVIALFAEGQRRTRDPLIGLRAGAVAEPRGALAYLLMSSPRLLDGLRQVARFAPLTLDTARVQVEVHGDNGSVTYDLGDAALAAQRHLVDYLLMLNLRAMQRAVGRPLQLREVQVRYAEPDCAEAAARLFGCPVRFARRRMRIVIPAGELRSAARLANPLIAEQIERFAAALLSRMTAATAVAERVADALRAALSAGVRADRASVARRLGMSDRTMQRGLEAEGTTFRAVREDVVRGAVEALLSNSTLKVDAVARSVGFGEMAAFSRAFKRWTGSSPTQYRRRLAQARTPRGRPARATARR